MLTQAHRELCAAAKRCDLPALLAALGRRGGHPPAPTDYHRKDVRIPPEVHPDCPDHFACVRLLLERTPEEDQGSAPLHLAAERGFAEGVAALLKAGANADARRVGGATPLHAAVAGDQPACVAALLDGGADPNAPDEARYGCEPIAVDPSRALMLAQCQS